jgi:hypothetical protein
MREILNNREATGKIAKWSIELSMYNVIYKPRIAINAQALSAFMAEWTETQTPPREWELEYWIINFDGSLQLQGARVGILVTPPKGESIKYVLQMHFPTSNNTAKYEALLYGPRIAIALSIHWLKVLGDSLLIVSIRPIKSGHVWMTKCGCIARSSASWKTISMEKMRSWMS